MPKRKEDFTQNCVLQAVLDAIKKESDDKFGTSKFSWLAHDANESAGIVIHPPVYPFMISLRNGWIGIQMKLDESKCRKYYFFEIPTFENPAFDPQKIIDFCVMYYRAMVEVEILIQQKEIEIKEQIKQLFSPIAYDHIGKNREISDMDYMHIRRG